MNNQYDLWYDANGKRIEN